MRIIINALCLSVCCLLTTPAAAQRIIAGTIYENTNNEPLPGAAVKAEGTNIGVVSDSQGRYELKLPENKEYVLCVTYTGYNPQKRKIGAEQASRQDFHLEESPINLDVVVVTGTRTPKLLKDAPIVTRVISESEIKKADVTHIGQLLQSELPGVEFSYSMSQQTSLNMQGFGGNSILFLVDGERVAGETLDNVDYSRLNLDNVERVEIVKGATSSLYGSNAVGGVVNIISKIPDEPWAVNVNSRFEQNNKRRYGASAAFNNGKFNSTTNVQHTAEDELEMPNPGAYSKIYANRTWNAKERLQYAANDQIKLTGRAGYFFRERDSQPTTSDRYRGFSGGLKGDYAIDDRSNLELAYAFDQYDKSNYTKFTSFDLLQYRNVQHSVRTLYNYSFEGNNTLTVGGDLMRDFLMSYQFTDNGDRNQYTADGFAQFDWNPLDRLNVIAGIRYDYFSEAGINHLSPKIGLMYQYDNCSLRGSYSGGFRAPTLKEMYMDFDMAGVFMIYGNPDLKPESSHNFSLSAEYIKNRYNLTVTGFFNQVDNRITNVWSNARNGMVFSNLDPVNIVGVDANAAAKFPCGFGIRLSYAYTHEHIREKAPLFSNTRPHTATVRLEYGKNWGDSGYNIVLSGRFLSRLNTNEYASLTSYEETIPVSYPGYTIWKLMLSRKIYKGMSLTATADNLFNYIPDYYYSNSPYTVGTTFSVGFSLDISPSL